MNRTRWPWQQGEGNPLASSAELLTDPVARQALDTLLAIQMRVELATGVPVALYGPTGQLLAGISPSQSRPIEQQLPAIKDLLPSGGWPQRVGQMLEVVRGNQLHFFVTPVVVRDQPLAQVVLGPLALFEPGTHDGLASGGEALLKAKPLVGVPVLASWRARAAAEVAGVIVSLYSNQLSIEAERKQPRVKRLSLSEEATIVLPAVGDTRRAKLEGATHLGSLAESARLPEATAGDQPPRSMQQVQEQFARLLAEDRSGEPPESPILLHQFLEACPQAVLVALAPGGQIVLTNQAARQLWPTLLGQEPAEHPGGAPPGRKVSLEQYPPEWQGLALALRQGAPLFRQALTIEPADQSSAPAAQPRSLLVSAFPLRDSSGAISHAVALFENLDSLLEREQFKDDVLVTAAHAIRNPLTIISSHAQLLERDLAQELPTGPGLERGQRRLAEIQEQTRLLSELTDQLCATVRLQSAHQPPQVETFNLARLVRQAIVDQQILSPGRGIEAQVVADPCIVQGNATQVQQVLLHLLKNAVKYSQLEKSVFVTLRAAPEKTPLWAEISVRDAGPGIPRASLPHLFERFYQVSTNEARERLNRLRRSTDRQARSGIGLYLCKQLIERMGGRIWAESLEGVGTTIWVTLPLKSS